MNPEEKRHTVANILQEARFAKRMSQQELATLMKCQKQTISNIETGKYSPNADFLYQLLDFLDVSLFLNYKKI